MCIGDLDGDDTFRCSVHMVEFGCFPMLDEDSDTVLCID
jgi:hypothetical protein